MDQTEKIEIIEAELVDESVAKPHYAFEDRKGVRKKPRGTRKKDFRAFTPKTRETILQTTGLGAPPTYAAKYAGISPSTLYRWLERGRIAQGTIEAGDESELALVEKDFANFFVQYNQVLATAVISLLGNLQKQARNNPNIALKLLEKLDPKEFGQRQAIDMNMSGKVGHLHVNARDLLDGGEVAKQLSTDELRVLRDSMKKRKQLEAGETKSTNA